MFKRLSLFATTALFVIAGTPFAHAAISNGAAAIDALGQYDDNLTNPQPVYTKGAINNAPNKLGLSTDSIGSSVAVDTVHHRLFVADGNNNRVLTYSLNSSNGISDHTPSYVLGQSNFYSNGAATTRTGMNGPSNLYYDSANDRIFVADYNNSRVLVFNVSSLSNGMSASIVLGQPTFTSSGAATTQSGMSKSLSHKLV